MTPEKVRAAAGKIDAVHDLYHACFGRTETRAHSRTYVRGLLLCNQRKTCEAMALRFATPSDGESPGRREVQAMQHFLTESTWDYHEVQSRTQALFAEKLAPSAAGSPVGVVGVIDESGDEKSGTHSCGAKNQWFGRLGKTETCQVGVFLIGVTPQGTGLLDHQLYLPQEWANDKARRKKTKVPKHIKFLTKPQIAIELLRRTLANGHVKFDWITADSLYGRHGGFLDALEEMQQKYVVETPSDTTFWTLDPATQIPAYPGVGPRPTKPTRDSVKTAQEIADELPESAWQSIHLRQGAKGPLVSQFARVRVWSVRHRRPGPAVWLVFRRDLGSQEVKFYVSHGGEEVSLETLALVIAERWRVEDFFEDGKQYLGLADYEARGWTSWHHHMSLVGIAHLYVMLVRDELHEETPELSFDRAFHLVCDALARPTLGPGEALRITEYHLNYNQRARQSHHKSWLRRHPDVAKQLRL